LTRLQVVKEIFEVFINRTIVYNYSHHIGLVTFSDNPNLVQRMTPVIEDLRCAVMGIQATGSTALWDALVACEGHLTSYAAQYPNARKRIVVLSDGQDTTGGVFSGMFRRSFRQPPPSSSDDSDDDPMVSSSRYSQGDFNTLPSPNSSTQNFSTPYAVSTIDPFSTPMSSSAANLSSTLPGASPKEPGGRYNSSSSGLSSYPGSMSPFGSITNSPDQNSSSQSPPDYKPSAFSTSNNRNPFIASRNPFIASGTLSTTALDALHTGDSTHTFVLPALSSPRITAQETCLRLQRNNIIVDSFFIGNGTNQDLKRISYA
jgi:hypothetical protein